MNYNEYIKDKLISLYLKNEKIGFSLTNKDTLLFLNDFIVNIKPYDYSLSDALSKIAKRLDKDKKLNNLLGERFLSELENLKDKHVLNVFQKQNSIEPPQITTKQKEELLEKYTEVAKQYGLKEFYYSLDPLLKPEENFNKALFLLNKTKLELNKLQQALDLKEHYKIGNGILSIQVNSQQRTKDNGDYDFLSNTIRLKDENSTFPLIHEYVHFIDKTTASLILTGKTTQQLYESENSIDLNFVEHNSKEYAEAQKNRKYTENEIKELFDMSIFNQVDYKKDKFPWINFKQLILTSIFNKEINQNKYIQEIFNQNIPKEDSNNKFKEIIFEWIEDENYPNISRLKKDIDNIFDNKKINFNGYSPEEIEVLGKTKLFKENQLEDNYFMKSSKLFDLNNSRLANQSIIIPSSNIEFVNSQINQYYQTQKEMLARTIEQTLKEDKHEQLSDRLTTPQLSQEETQKFFEIIKSWQNITHELLEQQKQQKQQNTFTNVQKVIHKFRSYGSKELEKELKFK